MNQQGAFPFQLADERLPPNKNRTGRRVTNAASCPRRPRGGGDPEQQEVAALWERRPSRARVASAQEPAPPRRKVFFATAYASL